MTALAISAFFTSLYIYVPVSTPYLQSKGLNYVQINSLWGILVATQFAIEVPAGLIGDRVGRKLSINLALALQVLGEVVYIFARGYPGFVLAAAIGGAGFAFASGCIEALIYDSLRARGRDEEMARAMGVIHATKRLANLLAFTAGGLLLTRLTQARFVLAIALTAGSVAVGFLISMVSGLYVALMGLVVGRVGDLWLPGAFLLMGGVMLGGGRWRSGIDKRSLMI